ncbi:MAG: LptE family protein [Nitrospirae bacterium]|nr:LptE family protein [Nitrospirota bacterium]
MKPTPRSLLMGRWLAPFLSLLLGLITGSFACGYQFVNRVNTLPSHIKRVAVGEIRNDTDEPHIQTVFYQAFQQEFSTDRRLNLTSIEKADAVLSGTLKRFSIEPLAYDIAGFPSKYRSTITVDLELYDKVKDEIYWDVRGYSRSDEYAASQTAGISKENEVLILKKLAVDAAEEIHRAIMGKM